MIGRPLSSPRLRVGEGQKDEGGNRGRSPGVAERSLCVSHPFPTPRLIPGSGGGRTPNGTYSMYLRVWGPISSPVPGAACSASVVLWAPWIPPKVQSSYIKVPAPQNVTVLQVGSL